ncbi:MAG: DNA (cytosine-5-)-methyltransferase [Mesorhizobium sp.]|nr:MAG: DNA (cytosine-5-)-methyltransferase [Mesorhizobium sp.]
MDKSGAELEDSREILPEVPTLATPDPLPDANPDEAADQHAEVETVAEVPREVSLPDLLKDAKDLIQRRRTMIARNILDIAKQIAVVAPRLPRSHLRALLVSEFGIDRADVATYLKLTDTLQTPLELTDAPRTQSDVLQKSGASFSVLKALVAAPETVRNDAVARMAQGNFIHSSEVTAMRRRHAEALDPKLAEARKHQKALRSAAQSKAQSDLSTFREEFLPFVQSLIDLFNEGVAGAVDKDDYQSKRVDLMEEAESCLTRFEALFDTSSLPPAWDGYFEQHQPDTARLARARDSLIDLATGAWKAVDLESGVPYDREETLLDRSIVESLIWLFEGNGFDESQLKGRKASVPAVAKAVQPTGRLRSLEICAGAGGQALGLHAAGFDSIGTFERNKDAVSSLKANGLFGTVHNADITTVDFRRYHGKVDLVAGGVPCQPHSRAGNRKGKADDRDLFLEAVRIVEEVRPRAFFFENVSGFGDKPAAAYRAELHHKFSALGYDNRIYCFSAKDLGRAQLRPRVAFIGFRDLPIARFQMPPTFPQWETTLGEALHDLVAANGWPGAEHWAKNVATKQGYTVVGASEKSGRQGFCSKSRNEDWAKLGIDWEELGDAVPGPDHPFDAKFRLTLEMGARLQGFPDDWVFHGSTRSRRRQIANALPPIMARAVGLAIHGLLTGTEYDFEKALRLPLPASHRGKLRLSSLPSNDWMDEPELLPV